MFDVSQHEVMFRTPKGAWILNSWTDKDDASLCFELLEKEDVAFWMVENGHYHEDLEHEISIFEV